MFSPRLLAVFAIIATVSAAPSSDAPIPRPVTSITESDFEDPFGWFSLGNFKNFFTPFLQWFPNLSDIGPKIEADENNFRVIINVDDYKTEDLKVKVKGDFMLVQGSREAKHDDHDLFASQFYHTYSLPENSTASAVTATLYSNHWLVIDAPNTYSTVAKKTEERDIPIVVSSKAYSKDESKISTDPAITEIASEPVTAADREEVTEKDNNIPHGNENEIQP